ncbi:MAG: YajQ family cyclic di-GMP-binding protein [Anaeromyxobacter sp.]|nr:YajQ family cyclic di-GMP-binding protein [Anaeromyxobacter sp.]MBL0278221.1 YajQ family cyclic di-GMP-binding protein [Anaeromyxobacter sp.]
MPSFDAVSELDMMEVENAWNQAVKEIAQRFDFKGTGTAIERDKELHFVVRANSEGRAEAALGVLMEKLAKRGVPMTGLDPQKVEPAGGSTVRQQVKLKKGLKSEDAKKVVALLKETGLKVQAAIQGEAVRVTGKKRDDLQAAMQALRAADLGLPLRFNNFRD